ncbi:RND efflux system, outer membrane lipoprotein, NodT family [Gluconacetobacter diazotrophicus PA1 5]|uniref:efflux transporter outer membrane subunit n=1 Tax=Gluconacetobacter diazotrophicus TaxID=33996 RepID=UPI000173C253|nr:efflux transporter outer membrane subunit [Gluconacetobacter diazotrophicus]ACI51578.1 RND efflux system, outer membrane lipoprotein, NodT family [Gluconacetobacter diazotrophicus PA1 5]TWB03433.1 NodT family efflux transporter outer membrane factor (OMF) lipoprotein [Gluconacetobacter diazotrophicus]
MKRAVPRVAAFALPLAIALASCTVGPAFHRPRIDAPPAWGAEPKAGSQTYAGAIDTRWWRSFDDAELTGLVDRLGRQNLDLQIAAQRIREARAQMKAVAAAGLPQANWSGSYAYRQLSTHGIFSLAEPSPGASLNFNLYSNVLSTSWDLDLFGAIRRGVEAQRADQAAALAARRAAALAAVSDLAASYMQLRGVQAPQVILQSNIALARTNLQLVRDRFANGVAANLDVSQAAAQLASMESGLPELENAEAALINAIGLLLSEPPRALEGELKNRAPQPRLPVSVPVGLPLDLTRRRPDVLEAEARLHAATAEVGAAIAAFYPDITLAGNMGTESFAASDFFSLPAKQFSVGPTLNVPVFQGGRLIARLAFRKAAQQEAVLTWRNTVLNAWREADDALTAYAKSQSTHALTEQALLQDRAAYTAARQRYGEGATDYLNVVATQAALLSTQSALADSQTRSETTLVALYRALGGGWEYAEPGR